MSITLLDDFLRTPLALMSYHEGARFAMSVALAEDPINSNAGEMAEWLKAAVC